MKILVCISKTPDTTAKISFNSEQTEFNHEGIQHIMNPYDEWYALVKALEIKEDIGGTVTAIHMGLKDNETVIRKALAIGADDAIRIDKEASSSLDVAKNIAKVVGDQSYDLILMGKETINYNGAEVGSMLAAILKWPFISHATSLVATDDSFQIERDIEGGTESLTCPSPMIVSAAKGIAEQRIPNMRGIMMAKRKPLAVIEPQDVDNAVAVVHYELPPQRTAVKLIEPDQMDTLVKLLHEEAKVI